MVNENFSECFKQVAKFSNLRSNLLRTPAPLDDQKQQQMINIFNELFIEINLSLCVALKFYRRQQNDTEKEKKLLTEYLKQPIIDSNSSVILNEKWYLAEYHVLLYELDSNKDLNELLRAYNFIKENPHPQLYKRICIHMVYFFVFSTKIYPSSIFPRYIY